MSEAGSERCSAMWRKTRDPAQCELPAGHADSHFARWGETGRAWWPDRELAPDTDTSWLEWLRNPLVILFLVLVALASLTVKHGGPLWLAAAFAALAVGTAVVDIATKRRR